MFYCLNKYYLCIIFFLGLALFSNSFALQSWPLWLHELKIDALKKGVSKRTFQQAFKNITLHNKVLRLNKRQPERRITFMEYRNSRVKPYRIYLGRRKYNSYKSLFKSIERDYGVDGCIIAAIWGMESSYGNFMGGFDVIRSLTTLAYQSPRVKRREFFRRELLYALKILELGVIEQRSFKGEWAGASGQPQFLPSSWFKYAKDYDGDGFANIWKSTPDSLASIANYLKEHGWDYGQPWSIDVILPYHFNNKFITQKTEKTITAWRNLGIKTFTGKNLPISNTLARIIKLDGGHVLLTFKNFNTLMKYNRSTYYAGTVSYLASKICRRKTH